MQIKPNQKFIDATKELTHQVSEFRQTILALFMTLNIWLDFDDQLLFEYLNSRVQITN